MINRKQALGQGVHPRQLVAMTDAGILARVHPGVWVEAAHSSDPLVLVRAASLYVGAHGLVSHRTAAWVQGLLPEPRPVTHVTVAVSSYPRYKGIRFHLTEALPASLPYRGIRCTTPARTIVDVAPGLTTADLNAVIDQALVGGLTRPSDLAREAAGRRRGCGLLRRSLSELGHIGVPDESRLEAEMRRLVRRFGLPAPAVQVKAGPDGCYRVDSAWVHRRVVVELYGYAWHHSPEQLARDAARQRQLTLEGWSVLVFTWRDVLHDPARVADDVRRALEGLAA